MNPRSLVREPAGASMVVGAELILGDGEKVEGVGGTSGNGSHDAPKNRWTRTARRTPTQSTAVDRPGGLVRRVSCAHFEAVAYKRIDAYGVGGGRTQGECSRSDDLVTRRGNHSVKRIAHIDHGDFEASLDRIEPHFAAGAPSGGASFHRREIVGRRRWRRRRRGARSRWRCWNY